MSLWFKAADAGLTSAAVFPEIGGYAAPPVLLNGTGSNGWHAIVKLPAGITPGRHEIRMRVRGSAYSNPVRIGVDVDEEEPTRRTVATSADSGFRIEGATDGKTWDPYRVHHGPDACISLWVHGLPDECRAADVRVRLGGNDLPCVFLSEPDPAGLRQVNALLPLGLEPGKLDVNVTVGDVVTPPIEVEILPGISPA